MAWEWILLAFITLLGPVIFHHWMPMRIETTFPSGVTYVSERGPISRIVHSMAKFAIIWIIALMLAQLERRLWLQLWVVLPAAMGLTFHFIFVRIRGVHWRTGAALR